MFSVPTNKKIEGLGITLIPILIRENVPFIYFFPEINWFYFIASHYFIMTYIIRYTFLHLFEKKEYFTFNELIKYFNENLKIHVNMIYEWTSKYTVRLKITSN